jgi:peptide/nickel transport system ATP-binding protein
MYLGAIVESGPAQAVLRAPAHPYTQALVAAVPRIDRAGGRRVHLAGDPPSPFDPPPGCRFHPRCAMATSICRQEVPVLRGEDRMVACHHVTP